MIPEERLPPSLTRTYEGTSSEVAAQREADAAALAARGYFPVAESWMPRSRSVAEIVAAIVLVFLVVGVLLLIYYWLRPLGTMTVVYERRDAAGARSQFLMSL